MKRRTFIKQAGAAAAGAFLAPYILPTGRLFAATGARKANHVVFCMFAGGVRNIESVQFKDGNLLSNLLSSNKPISLDIAAGMTPLPPNPLSYRLDTKAVLFKEFQYREGPTGHFNGHTVALTGQYSNTDLVIRENPKVPTIFEYYRKHNSPLNSANNCWWVANTLGPYPALNYSTAPGYGSGYGANFIAPTALFDDAGQQTIQNVYNFSNNEKQVVEQLRGFTNQVFNQPVSNGDAGIINPESDRAQLDQFINKIFLNNQTNPWSISGGMSNDMLNIYFAEEILKEFKPELLVVNMQDVDVAHFNFTNYANNLRRADYAVAHLWNTIQNTPGLANDTILIIAPEHGRNLDGNNSIDAYGRAALDHTANVDINQGDQTAREIFCMVAGPAGVVKQGTVFGSGNPLGESTEIVPAIANILGFDTAIPGGMLVPSSNNQLLLNGFF